MTPVEKLVQQIRRAVTENADRVTLERLAAEYASQCQAANRRLEQCETMLADGNHDQVIELAETPPAVLDQVAALSFDGSEEWRKRCRSSNLPVPEPFNERAIARLNDLYQKGISAQHPLYRDYREAMLKRDDERALSILRSILKLNKSDGVAKTECQRLEQKLREQKLAELDRLLQKGDVPKALDLLARLETLFRTPALTGAVFERARGLREEKEREQARRRCQELIVTIEQLHQANQWREAFDLVREVENLCQVHSLTLEPELMGRLHQLRAWAGGLKTRFDEEQRYRESVQQLNALAQQRTARTAKATRQSLAEDLAVLAGKRAEVELSGRSMPEELVTLVGRREAELRAELARRAKQQQLLIGTLVVAVLAIFVGGVLWFQRQQGVASAVEGANTYIRDGDLQGASNFLSHLSPELAQQTRLQELHQRLDRLLTEETQNAERVQGKVKQLEDRLRTDLAKVPEDEANHAFQDAYIAIGALKNMASRTELSNRVAQVWGKYQGLQKDEKNKEEIAHQRRDEQLTKWLDQMEQDVDKLVNNGDNLERVRQTVQKFTLLRQQVDQLIRDYVREGQPIPPECMARLTKVKGKAEPVYAALASLEKAETDMRRARTAEEYWMALGKFAAEPQTQDLSEVQGAQRILAARPKLADVSEQLLMPENPEAWSSFKANPKADLYPGEIQADEVSKLLTVRDDDNLRNVYRYVLPERVTCIPSLPMRVMYTRGPGTVTSRINTAEYLSYRFTANAYVPAKDSDRAEFVNRDFKCEIKNPGEGSYELQGERAAECTMFIQIGFNDLVDVTANKFRKPLLPMLDAVGAAPVSPLFRAYLQYQLLELLSVRPPAWGAHWAPILGDWRAKLKRLGAPDLRSGDWMVPSRNEMYRVKLEGFYRDSTDVSCMKQARCRQALIQKAYDAGFAYAGFVASSGKPEIRPEAESAGEVWALAADSGKLARFYRIDQGKLVAATTRSPQVLTPLFIWKAERKVVIQEASGDVNVPADDPAMRASLPPLFQ